MCALSRCNCSSTKTKTNQTHTHTSTSTLCPKGHGWTFGWLPKAWSPYQVLTLERDNVSKLICCAFSLCPTSVVGLMPTFLSTVTNRSPCQMALWDKTVMTECYHSLVKSCWFYFFFSSNFPLVLFSWVITTICVR